MKVSIYNNFGALNSAPVLSAVAQGLQRHGHVINYHNDSADVAVIWSQLWAGRMKPNKQVWDLYNNSGRPVLIVEVGAINRNTTWRLMLNGKNNILQHGNSSYRFDQLGMKLFPWKKHGDHILIACQRPESQQWQGQPSMDQWINTIITSVRQHSDRPIHIRAHPRHRLQSIPVNCVIAPPVAVPGTYDAFDFEQAIESAWSVINFNSNPAVTAALHGTPIFVDHSSIAAPVGNLDLAQIENPLRPDRQQWAWDLAHTEWSTQEIAIGVPFEQLQLT